MCDPVAACVASAKLQLGMLYLLLSDGAKTAQKVIDEYVPMFASNEEYFKFIDSLNCLGDRIDYSDRGNVSVRV